MISIDREMLWQWDYGQRVQLHDVHVGTAVHFSNAAIKPNALVTEAYEDGEGVYANIPDILLQTAGTLTAYIYIEDGDEGHTEYRKMFIVRDREKPDDYVYTEDDVKTWVSLEERIKVLEESGGGGAGGLIRPLSEIGEIDGVTVVHNAEKDKVTLQVEMTAERVNSLFGGNVVYKSDYPNAQALDIIMRSPGMSYMVMWELFEDDFITVTNYPKKKYIMVSTNHMVVSFDYDENGEVTGKRETHQASVQQLNEVKAAVPNRATVNSAHALVMQRADGDNVTDLFGAYIPFAFESYKYFSDIDWGTTLGSSFVVRDPYVSKGDVYPAIPDGCEAPFICHTTLVRYTLTVIVCTADGRFFKTHLDLPSMKFSSVTEITQQGGGTSDTLPNPHPLTFTGAVEATYDGSMPVSVEIPMRGGAAEGEWELIGDVTVTSDVNEIAIKTDTNGNPFVLKRVYVYGIVYPTTDEDGSSGTGARLALNDKGISWWADCRKTRSLTHGSTTEKSLFQGLIEDIGGRITTIVWNVSANVNAAVSYMTTNGDLDRIPVNDNLMGDEQRAPINAIRLGSYAKAIGAGSRIIAYGVKK